MKENKISIIVPIYNAEKTLKKCVDSLILQSHKNIEVLLIDDGSIDNSSKICNEYLTKDDRIKYYYKKNGGVSSARNLGLEKAKGDYIAFVDSDDYVEHNMYELMLKSIIEKKCDVAICNLVYEDEFNNIIYNFEYEDFVFEKIEYPKNSYYIKSISGYACNKLYSRKIIYHRANNGIKFSTNIVLSEDDLFNYEILNNNKVINYTYINKKLYHYVLNRNSAVNKNFNLRKLTYFDAKEKEINILKQNNINNDFLKADYIINQIRTFIIMNKLKIDFNKKFENIIYNSNKYKKEISYKNIKISLLLKLFIAIKLPIIYKIKLIRTFN